MNHSFLQSRIDLQMMLDEIDRRILMVLQEHGRMTMNDLADAAGLSATPCLRRVKKMEDLEIIRGYASLVNQVAVGLPISVFVTVTLQRQTEENLDQFEATIKSCSEVMECYLMTGTSDFLLRVVAADLSAYEIFLKRTLTRVPGIANIQSSFALKQIVHRIALPLNIGR